MSTGPGSAGGAASGDGTDHSMTTVELGPPPRDLDLHLPAAAFSSTGGARAPPPGRSPQPVARPAAGGGRAAGKHLPEESPAEDFAEVDVEEVVVFGDDARSGSNTARPRPPGPLPVASLPSLAPPPPSSAGSSSGKRVPDRTSSWIPIDTQTLAGRQASTLLVGGDRQPQLYGPRKINSMLPERTNSLIGRQNSLLRPDVTLHGGKKTNSLILPESSQLRRQLERLPTLVRPIVGVVGGMRLKEKARLIDYLLDRCDELILGGGIALTFKKAENSRIKLGKSAIEDDQFRVVADLLEKADERNVMVHLPSDFVCGSKMSADAETMIVGEHDGVPDTWFALDIGPASAHAFGLVLNRAKTIIWTGPMGAFELEKFSFGTKMVIDAVVRSTEAQLVTVVAGGATEAAIGRLTPATARVAPMQVASPFAEDPNLPVVFKSRSIELRNIIAAREAGLPAEAAAPQQPGIVEEADTDEHKVDLDVLTARLGTNITTGFTDEQAKKALAQHGPNSIDPPKRNMFLQVLIWLFADFGSVLWLASVLSFLAWRPIGDPPDPSNLGLGVLLLIVIGVSFGFTVYQEHSSSEVMKTIKQMLPVHARALRNGEITTVALVDVVPGDIVLLEGGDRVPADMRLFDVDDIKMDQSLLTGESDAVVGSATCTDPSFMESRNMAFTGTRVMEGRGRGVVIRTGNKSVTGKIAALTASATQATTPLQAEIHYFVVLVACIAFAVAISVVIAWAAWLRTTYSGYITTAGIVTAFISCLVAFIPEGMPVCVTLSLTIIARRMLDAKVLVKNLVTVETLGAVEVLASDKTGTLTQNRMSVFNIAVDRQVYGLRDEADRNILSWRQDNVADASHAGFHQFVTASVLCNQAVLDPSTADLPLREQKALGNSTDAALFMFAHERMDVDHVRTVHDKLAEVPFNSRNKWMLSVLEYPRTEQSEERLVVLLKGAPEAILRRCGMLLTGDGGERPMSEAERAAVAERQEEFGSQGMRVLAVCRMILDSREWSRESFEHFGEEDVQEGGRMRLENMTLLGLVALVDPPRAEVPDAVAAMRRAGIRVAMVTGDHPSTAASIARQVGIITSPVVHQLNLAALGPRDAESGNAKPLQLGGPDDAITVKGSDIDSFIEDKRVWDLIASKKEIVFARTTPEHKLRIVNEFQKRDKMVAVTGDGVNDSPALKKSDLGIAMGAGSDVAREAADMVLLSNDFSSIVTGVRLGRVLHDNLKKVCLFLLPAGTFAEVLTIVFNVFLGIPTPLSGFEMIFISCGTDLVTSLPMIAESAESDVMLRKPRHRVKDRLINWKLLVQSYLFLGVFTTFACFFMYFFYWSQEAGVPPTSLILVFSNFTDGFQNMTMDQLNEHLYRAQTCYFVGLVMVQIGNLFATRTRRVSLFQHQPFWGPARNLRIFAFQALALALALIVVYVPVFNDVFKTRPIKAYFWFFPLGWGVVLFALDELRKWAVRRYPRGFLAKIAW